MSLRSLRVSGCRPVAAVVCVVALAAAQSARAAVGVGEPSQQLDTNGDGKLGRVRLAVGQTFEGQRAFAMRVA